jgi:hypothetical protein
MFHNVLPLEQKSADVAIWHGHCQMKAKGLFVI